MERISYVALKNRQQTEVNEFPMMFAFNQKQFEDGMQKLGFKPTQVDKVYSLSGTGGFYRKTDSDAFHEMMDRHTKEMQDAIDSDETGEGFIFEMFDYELANHEYSYTMDVEDTLDALGVTQEDLHKSPSLLHGLELAMEHQSNS